jgi:hypothetical protein
VGRQTARIVKVLRVYSSNLLKIQELDLDFEQSDGLFQNFPGGRGPRLIFFRNVFAEGVDTFVYT